MATPLTPANQSELEAASERLAQLEAEQAKELGEVTSESKTDDTLHNSDRAEDADMTEAAKPDSSQDENAPVNDKTTDKTDAKRSEDGKFTKQNTEPVKTVNEPAPKLTPEEEKKFSQWLKHSKSKYAHDEGKRLIRWDKIKEEETRLATVSKETETKFAQARAKFDADVQTFRAEQQAAQPTPERFEAYASQLQSLVTLKEAEMVKAEAAGDFDKVEQLKAEIILAKDKAQSAKSAAEEARKNPPLDAQKQQEQFQAYQRQWIDKAAIDFPEFGKKNSPLQQEAANYFKQMSEKEPAVAKLPGFIYYCAERAALKLAADRVPNLEKELGELRTKVKELDALTNPSPRGGGGVQRPKSPKGWDQMSSEEQFDALRQEASQRR
jgi:hypothetical protein